MPKRTMALIVAARAGITDIPAGPDGAFWLVLALTALSAVGNLTTPSPPERRVWGPVTVVMLLCASIVAVARRVAQAPRKAGYGALFNSVNVTAFG